MTNEEAIQRVRFFDKKAVCDHEACDGDCNACVEAIGMAISALEKQAIIKRKLEWLKGFDRSDSMNIGQVIYAFEDCVIDWSDSNEEG